MGWTKEANTRRKDRYWQRKNLGIEFLGGKCVCCGSTEKLQFDHIKRSTRKYRFPHFYKLEEKLFYEELKKCQLLCRSCHDKKSVFERGRKYGKGIHGNINNYKHHGCRCELCRKANSEDIALRRSLGKI
jgi:hypothetical protein